MNANTFCFYLQNRLIQTSHTGGQQYSDTSPLVFLAKSKLTEPLYSPGYLSKALYKIGPIDHIQNTLFYS
jgi:hypothetical protein